MSVAVTDPVRATYDAFAGFYDAFTEHHDYAAATARLEEAAVTAGLSGHRMLDLACGTGKSFLPMLDRGYEITGVDLSPPMLERAARRAAGRARLVPGDLRSLPDLGAFDLAWSLGEALSYLLTEEELAAALAGAARCLAPGGVLLFDLATLRTFRTLLAGLLVQPGADRVLVLDGHGDAALEPGGTVTVRIEELARGEDGRWSRVRTEHRHRHHPVELIEALVRGAGLELVAAHGSRPDGTLVPVVDEGRHVKSVFIARRGRA